LQRRHVGDKLVRFLDYPAQKPNMEKFRVQISIAARWPEWERAYLALGLLLEASKQGAEARRNIQTAIALGGGMTRRAAHSRGCRDTR
jgi:hypothetical protein